MSEEDFRKIFRKLIEKKQLDPDTAERLLQRILKILFPDSDDKKPKGG